MENFVFFLCLMNLFFDNEETNQIIFNLYCLLHFNFNRKKLLQLSLASTVRQVNIRMVMDHTVWLEKYNDTVFYQLFRMKKVTFYKLMNFIMENDKFAIIKKKFRGGYYPINSEKSLLVFIWYVAHKDTLHQIGDRFDMVPSTVMQIVNSFLYVIISVKKKIIFWPRTVDEYTHILNGFRKYPGTIGALDGTHINVKVPSNQHDSYLNRHQQHSINLMAICTAEKMFTYIFIGYPGSAHDSRVFSNSSLVKHIEMHGKTQYFPKNEYHLIGDSAFPLKSWLITPYKKNVELTRKERTHNYFLSSDRVCIENTFGLLKSRFARLQFINVYNICKAIEITTAACVLHNFCYMEKDTWKRLLQTEQQEREQDYMDDRLEQRLGKEKRDQIAQSLINNEL